MGLAVIDPRRCDPRAPRADENGPGQGAIRLTCLLFSSSLSCGDDNDDDNDDDGASSAFSCLRPSCLPSSACFSRRRLTALRLRVLADQPKRRKSSSSISPGGQGTLRQQQRAKIVPASGTKRALRFCNGGARLLRYSFASGGRKLTSCSAEMRTISATSDRL